MLWKFLFFLFILIDRTGFGKYSLIHLWLYGALFLKREDLGKAEGEQQKCPSQFSMVWGLVKWHLNDNTIELWWLRQSWIMHISHTIKYTMWQLFNKYLMRIDTSQVLAVEYRLEGEYNERNYWKIIIINFWHFNFSHWTIFKFIDIELNNN